MSRLALKGLTKAYPGADHPAVAGLTLSLAQGEMLGLIGPSGCGKSTTLRMIAGLLAPDAGEVSLDGRSLARVAPEARGTVLMFQDHLLFPTMSVGENVGFGLRMRGLPRAEVRDRVARMLEMVRLPGMEARRPAGLSGGQQQRVALARALITGPRVLLLDEPLSNLDAHLRHEMRDLIADLHRALGLTTILVTHDLEEAVGLCDRLALMLEGRLVQEGPPAAFFTRPESAQVARFFGARTLVPGRAEGGVFHSVLGSLTLPPGARQGAGHLVIRPEAARILPPGRETGAENILSGVLTECRYLGTRTRLTVTVAGVALDVMVPPPTDPGPPGTPVRLSLAAAGLWVVA